MKKEVIKVFIADDHDIIRQGLRRIISFEEELCIIGEAPDGDKALALIAECTPDVILLDCNMPLKNGIEVLKLVKEKNTDIKIIMLTIENDRKTIRTAIDIGADGYMLKDSAGKEIVSAIKMVYKGEKYIDKSLISFLFLDMRDKDKKEVSPLDPLTKRELEVLFKIAKGLSNKEIGEQLYLSEKTVKNYATALFRKINVYDRVQATLVALQNNIEDYYKIKHGDE
ncbi:response regulator [Cellulosilyticum sp. I15G10I2]|uniref:response regulator n=1 Tax=Cellulosilyticum sp. I15G10I2 TaxID=1892843 RepID=UPI00085C3394|nr:response regulator transcription factor [Cellulosilyticum sp. I15G10I2]